MRPDEGALERARVNRRAPPRPRPGPGDPRLRGDACRRRRGALDLGAIREQQALFGAVAADATAYRLIEQIAADSGLFASLQYARKAAREHAWCLGLAPERVTIDLDATLVGSHSEKEGAAGNFKGGFGFHPMLAYFDETSEAAAAMLRPGNAGANAACDQIAVAEAALEQIPAEQASSIEVLLRFDSAGASHELIDWAREGRIGFSVGYDLTESVREAVLALPESPWQAALEQGGSTRANGEVAEITERLDLSARPEGARVIVRRERPHPGAQLSFSDADGHRFQAILTDQDESDIAGSNAATAPAPGSRTRSTTTRTPGRQSCRSAAFR